MHARRGGCRLAGRTNVIRGVGAWVWILAALPAAAPAAESGGFDGALLSLPWALPFVGMLLSIALLPLLALALWHNHYGKIALAWSLLFLIPFAIAFGPQAALREIVHTLLAEYLPFMILLLALYTVTGGIHIRGDLRGTPLTNTALLAIGTGCASVMGTTGAAMLFIRPLLRANEARRYKTHVVVFFIFLVANVGGALTPLGDPPLFLGFLKGVDFLWTARAMLLPTATVATLLLAIFFFLDLWLHRRHERPARNGRGAARAPLGIDGLANLLLFGPLILTLVVVSGIWNPGIDFTVAGVTIGLQDVLRDVGLLALVLLSWFLTPMAIRRAHHFEWAPMVEVAKLFAGIFVTMIPALAMLKAGRDGALAPLVALVTDEHGAPIDAAYFWLTGVLSSFLDNAPTYLVFFNLAGGDAQALMHHATTLTAISAGAVFMGANTYIGNAPNFMVRSIAESRGVRMPGFFGYMAWSALILLPTFALLTWIFFR